MDARSIPQAIEPSTWYVVFHASSESRLVSFLSFGRFKHVSAFAYYAGFKGWLVFDPTFGRISLSMIPHEQNKLLLDYIAGAKVIKYQIKQGDINFGSRFGLYCVPAIKYLLGLSCVAVRPDGLYRHIVNNGGTLIDEHFDSVATPTAARPVSNG